MSEDEELDLYVFTFHYVSINTQIDKDAGTTLLALHSTMFLLIRTDREKHIHKGCLYIPLCFY